MMVGEEDKSLMEVQTQLLSEANKDIAALKHAKRLDTVTYTIAAVGGVVLAGGLYAGVLSGVSKVATINGLCSQVDVLECRDKKCTEMKKTCKDFRDEKTYDYKRITRQLSEGLHKVNARKQRMARGMQKEHKRVKR